MALTNEQAEEHKNDYAVTCCRLEAGADNEIFERSLKEKEEVEKAVVRESTGDKTAVIAANQFIRIHIGKGKDINLEIPVSTGASTLS